MCTSTSQGKGDKFLCLYFLSCRLKCLSWDFTEGNHCTHSGTRNPQRFSPKINFFLPWGRELITVSSSSRGLIGFPILWPNISLCVNNSPIHPPHTPSPFPLLSLLSLLPPSGPDDYVFVYFADHGAPGIVAFPDKMVRNAHSEFPTILF